MHTIRVKMLNGVDEYRPTAEAEAWHIINTAVSLGKKVIAFKGDQRIFDNVNSIIAE